MKEKEIYFISYFNSFGKKGYNMTAGGDGLFGFSHTDETKQKLRDARKGKFLTNETKQKIGNASKGRIHTDERNRKISDTKRGTNHHNAKLTEEDILQIKELIKIGLSQTEIANKFNVNHATISDIKRGNTWSHIGENVSKLKTSNRKLTVDDVREIKQMLKNGINKKEIANKFNVSPSTISDIKLGRSWRNIEIA